MDGNVACDVCIVCYVIFGITYMAALRDDQRQEVQQRRGFDSGQGRVRVPHGHTVKELEMDPAFQYR